jgi:phage-related holin
MEGFYKITFAGGSTTGTFLFGGLPVLLSVLGAFVILDFVVALGDQNFIRDATIFCYLAGELLSILLGGY